MTITIQLILGILLTVFLSGPHRIAATAGGVPRPSGAKNARHPAGS